MAVSWRNEQRCWARPLTPGFSPAPLPTYCFDVCGFFCFFFPLQITKAPQLEFQRWRSLSSLFCHFCPNRLGPPVIQIAGIQKQFKNCPAKPIRLCFANMAQPVFSTALSHRSAGSKPFVHREPPARVSQGSNVISYVFVHQTKKRNVFHLSVPKRIARTAPWSGIEFYCREKLWSGNIGGVSASFSSLGSPQKSSAIGNNEVNTSADRNPGPPAVSSV